MMKINKKIRLNLVGFVALLFVLAAVDFVVPLRKTSALSEVGGAGGIGGGGTAASGAGAASGVGTAAVAAQTAVAMFQTNCGMGGGPTNFGGRVKVVCSCKGGGMILKIGPPKGGNYYFGPGSIAYMFGPPKPGVWTLGFAGGIKVCYDFQKKSRPMSGRHIRIVGTSLY